MTFCARRQERKNTKNKRYTHQHQRTKPVWKEEKSDRRRREKEIESENITTSASTIFARLCLYYILRPFFRVLFALFFSPFFVIAIATVTYVHVNEHVVVCACVSARYMHMYIPYMYIGMCACLLMARVSSPFFPQRVAKCVYTLLFLFECTCMHVHVCVYV